MTWTYVFAAALVEVFWVIGLKSSQSLWEWAGTILLIVLSFFFVIKACERLPAGTVYAVFTGSGAAVLVGVEFVVYDSPFSVAKLFFVCLIMTGVIGIKLTTKEQETQEQWTEQKPAHQGGK